MRPVTGSLAWGTDSESLQRELERFDGFISAEVVRERDGKSKGYGFAYFNSDDALQTACAAMDGKEMDGRQIQMRKAQEKTEEQRRAEREQRMAQGGGYGARCARLHYCACFARANDAAS